MAFAPPVVTKNGAKTVVAGTYLDTTCTTSSSATRLHLFGGKPSSDSKAKKQTKGADTNNSKKDEKKGFPFVMLLGRPQQNWTTGTKSYTNSQRQNWLNPKKKNQK